MTGGMHVVIGQSESAVPFFHRALAVDPAHPHALFELANAHLSRQVRLPHCACCPSLPHTVSPCLPLSHPASHCLTLPVTVSPCLLLSHPASPCLTLPHPTSFCLILPRATPMRRRRFRRTPRVPRRFFSVPSRRSRTRIGARAASCCQRRSRIWETPCSTWAGTRPTLNLRQLASLRLALPRRASPRRASRCMVSRQLASMHSSPHIISSLARRRPAEATAAYERATTAPPPTCLAYNGLSNAYEVAGRFDEARAASDRAIRTLPDCDLGYYNLGRLLRAAERSAVRARLLNPSALHVACACGVCVWRACVAHAAVTSGTSMWRCTCIAPPGRTNP